MAREVDLGLMCLLFRFHYAMVVYVAVMNWTNCYTLPRARGKTAEDSSKRWLDVHVSTQELQCGVQ